MAVEIISSEPVRYRFMREVVRLLAAECPEEMRAAAAQARRTVQEQLDPKTGKWRTDAGGLHFKVSFPSIFMITLRPLMRMFLPEEPPFAQDDSDLIWLAREVPDLVKGVQTERPVKKDWRPRTRIA